MTDVHAVIELKITPQRDSGFGRIAERISRYEQVEACFLMSGAYDLLVFVRGRAFRTSRSSSRRILRQSTESSPRRPTSC